MNCYDFEGLMILKVFGKITGEDNTLLDAHLRECQKCERKMSKQHRLESVFEHNNEIPFPDWEKSWRVIEHAALDKRKRPGLFLGFRWIYVAAAVLIFFAFGIFIGRQWVTPTRTDIMQGPAPAPFGFSSIQDYTERLELILVSFLNRSEVSRPESFDTLEQRILQDIINQTLVLKGLAGQRGDQYQVLLLEDLELILRNIANLKSEDRRAADQLSRMIRDKDLRFKLKSLENWDRSF